MKNVSLTYFVDFVLKSGSPKLTVVQNFKRQGEYDPQTDFYKPFREKLLRALRSGGQVSAMAPWIDTVHAKKRPAYREALAGVHKVLGRKSVKWFDPPRTNYSLGPMTLTVNPELGLALGDRELVLKLYLKEDKLVKNRADLIVHLLRESLGRRSDCVEFGVLDARAGKLFCATPTAANLQALLAGEAASFATMHGSL